MSMHVMPFQTHGRSFLGVPVQVIHWKPIVSKTMAVELGCYIIVVVDCRPEFHEPNTFLYCLGVQGEPSESEPTQQDRATPVVSLDFRCGHRSFADCGADFICFFRGQRADRCDLSLGSAPGNVRIAGPDSHV